MKKFLLLIIIFLLNGCMKYTELNNLAIIKNIGIEYDNTYTLYALIIDEVTKDNIPKMKVIKVNGNNVDELFNNIKLLVNKEIYLDHIDLLILDKNIKKDNLKEIIYYFLNHQELRNDFLTITGSNIENILKNTQYDEIEKIILTNKKIIKIRFEEIISKFLDNKNFALSEVIYDSEIQFRGDYQYNLDKLERMNNRDD